MEFYDYFLLNSRKLRGKLGVEDAREALDCADGSATEPGGTSVGATVIAVLVDFFEKLRGTYHEATAACLSSLHAPRPSG